MLYNQFFYSFFFVLFLLFRIRSITIVIFVFFIFEVTFHSIKLLKILLVYLTLLQILFLKKFYFLKSFFNSSFNICFGNIILKMIVKVFIGECFENLRQRLAFLITFNNFSDQLCLQTNLLNISTSFKEFCNCCKLSFGIFKFL